MFYLAVLAMPFLYTYNFIVGLILILIGYVIVPPMALFHKYTTRTEWSTINSEGKAIKNWKYRFMYVWSNQEDGVYAGDELINAPIFIRIIYWTCIRNPVNNLRFIKTFGCIIDKDKIRFMATPITDYWGNRIELQSMLPVTPMAYYLYLRNYDMDSNRFITFTTCGIYSNFRIQFKIFNRIFRFWVGYKIYPEDAVYGLVYANDYRLLGAGFATQFKRCYPRK